jgi:hypothetical protein
MATLPSANTTVVDTAVAVATGLDTIVILAPVPTNADMTPRQFGDAAAIYAQHGYSEGLEYAALHAERTKKPMIFIGLPIETAGVIGREDTSGNTGSCVTTLAAGGSGVLSEHDGVLTVITGGTVGTSQIVLGLSLDGGVTTKRVKLGTNTSYTIPYVGVTVSFTTSTLVAGDTIHTWHGTAPLSDATGWATARAALAAQLTGSRSWLLCGDLLTDTEAAALLAQVDAYRTSNDRFVGVRASVYDREPLAALSSTTVRMTGAPTLTWVDGGGSADTIVRSAGSWITDGFYAGCTVTVTGSNSNNESNAVVSLDATTLALATGSVVAEVATAGCTVIGVQKLTFSASADTITRSAGSWLDDGFREGASVTVVGTAGGTNDVTKTVVAVSALVLDLGDGLADETIKATSVTIGAGQTKAVWMAELAEEFESVAAAPRINLSAGRGRILSPWSLWNFRRPAGWFASLREYQHDLHIATWRKADGPVGANLFDTEGNLAEWDDRVDGAAGCAAGLTTLRTWANGPAGAFIALDLTRATEGSLLTLQHNQRVVDLACTVVQLNTENVIGRSLTLDSAGHATQDSLSTIESEVNEALEKALLQNAKGEGPRCSKCVWTASRTDILNVPEAVLNGTLELNLNGTIHTVNTQVRVS